jgi:hypothetical protein
MPETQETFDDLPILRELRSDLARACAQASRHRADAPTSPRRRWSGSARLASAVAVPALAAVSIFIATVGAPASHAPQPGGSHVGPQPTSTAAGEVKLIGYTFRVPVSYQVSNGSSCGSTPSGVESLVVLLSSTNYGCISLGVVSGSAASPPSAAQSVTVGPDNGYWYSPASGVIDLYVDTPAALGRGDPVVVTAGRTLEQDVELATSGVMQNGQWGLPDYEHATPGAPVPGPGIAPGS